MGWFDWFRRKPKLVVDNDSQELTKEEIEEGVISKKENPVLSEMVKEGVEDLISKQMEEATVELAKFEEPKQPKRARTKKGTYKSDDKSTPDVNEAWVGGKAPKPKKKNVKVVRKKKK
tara:strand:- start:7073 stop:7426 length:354 start_codon:yes stop_codon:yes gene_type:complete